MQQKTSAYIYSLFGSIPELVVSSSMLAAAISLQVSRFSPGKHVSDGLSIGGNRACFLFKCQIKVGLQRYTKISHTRKYREFLRLKSSLQKESAAVVSRF
jgi:hypothetical protein